MNKEQAKEILKMIRHNSTMQIDYTIDDIDQALDIAIESLEKYPLLKEIDTNKDIADEFKRVAWKIAIDNSTLRAENGRLQLESERKE